MLSPFHREVYVAFRSPHMMDFLLSCLSAVSIHCNLIRWRYPMGVRSGGLFARVSRASDVQMFVFVVFRSPVLCCTGQYIAKTSIGPPLVARKKCVRMSRPTLSSRNADGLVHYLGRTITRVPPHRSPRHPFTGFVCVTVPIPCCSLAICPIHHS